MTPNWVLNILKSLKNKFPLAFSSLLCFNNTILNMKPAMNRESNVPPPPFRESGLGCEPLGETRREVPLRAPALNLLSSRRGRADGTLSPFNERPACVRESGWYHGSFFCLSSLCHGAKGFLFSGRRISMKEKLQKKGIFHP